MNQIAYGGLTAHEPAERQNQRALAKQRTREKLLGAARVLFAERGYEGATIRDIAKSAGMSTGAVFASFTDKSDLFTEIAETDMASLYASMRQAAEGLSGQEAILAMLDAAVDHRLPTLALFQAIQSALWTPGLSDLIRRRLDRRTAASLLHVVVKQDICPDGSGGCSHLIADMIWDGCIAVLRRAALDGLTAELVKARIHQQTNTILAGLRRG
ncbi:MAG TPA: helix-turn-helix domain-containing protein [Caulobacteraceae bacterium]|nr:helix-turn-helix domain-containing protein [Caulobacteraceae bacterium]